METDTAEQKLKKKLETRSERCEREMKTDNDGGGGGGQPPSLSTAEMVGWRRRAMEHERTNARSGGGGGGGGGRTRTRPPPPGSVAGGATYVRRRRLWRGSTVRREDASERYTGERGGGRPTGPKEKVEKKDQPAAHVDRRGRTIII